MNRQLQSLILRLLRRIGPAYRTQLLAYLSGTGQRPNVHVWLEPMTEALLPVVGRLWRHGAQRGLRGIVQQLRVSRARQRKGLRYIRKDFAGLGWSMDWNLFNWRIEQAIREATFDFCRSTLETIDGDVDTAMDDLRAELLGGLQAGEALQTLTARVQSIFDDPQRAFRIAITETQRAVHGGQLLAAKESGIVDRKRWLASSDACPECLKLNGKEVALDEPFYVDPKGGPYALVQAPPRHPNCMCSLLEVVNYDLVERGPVGVSGLAIRERLNRLEELV